MNKKITWSLVGIVTFCSLWFIYTYFEKAIPFVQLSITMNKQQAEHEATNLSKELLLETAEYDHAVKFESDDMLQAFVELEGGGKQAYLDMIAQNYHQPYIWQVRFYKEKEIKETNIWFTPAGKKYGFMQKLPEDMPGNNVSKAKAQLLAEKFVVSWDVDIKKYKLVEYEQQVRPSKRVDHMFVYERQDVTLKKGLYRCKVIVSGDKVTGLQHFVKVPDEFMRRYTQMYSANTLLAQVSTSIAVVFYIFIIGLFGFIFLYRRRYLLFAQHGKMLVVLGALFLAAQLNSVPLMWNYYVTTSSTFFFMMQMLCMMLLGVLMQVTFFGVIFLLAEALGRYVFGKHIQFFKLWSLSTAGSYTVLQQTLIGYCYAIFELAYIVGFYMLANSWGWWHPLSSLFDPNTLSMPMPFLTPVITAFRAGFWEEFAFRALPIAGTLLLTRHSKHKSYWVVAILIIQALLFGGVHANYAQQPAYFRIVEMFVGSVGFGLLYYFFGLLPVIVCHYAYDAILMLIPIWASSFMIQKVLGIFCIGIPLWVVLFRTWQQGSIQQVPKQSYNEAWQPAEKELTQKPYKRFIGFTISKNIQQYLYMFGVIGLLLFAYSKDFQFDTPPVTITKEQAKHIARQAIRERFGDIGNQYQELISFIDSVHTQEGNKFIYQTYGRQAYADLQNSYVMPPYYAVRYAKFTGSVEERAEEYGAWIASDNIILNVWHKLPEAAKGNDVSEAKAQSIAYSFVDEQFGLSKKDIELVSSESKKHEHRRDWIIVLQDVANYYHENGQARITINIGGDQVVGSMRYVYAPEDWQRAEQERLTKKGLMQAGSFWILVLLISLFALLSFRHIGLQSVLLRAVGLGTIVFFVIRSISLLLRWKQAMFAFDTSQPFMNQVSSLLMSHLVSGIGSGLLLAILLSFAILTTRKGLIKELQALVLPAMAAGCGVIGLFALCNNWDTYFEPQMPLYEFLNFKNLASGMIINRFISETIWSFITIVAAMTVANMLYQRYASEYVRFTAFVVTGLAVCGSWGGCNVTWHFILGGFCWGLVWYVLCNYVYEQNIELLFITIVTMQVLSFVPSVWYGAYPGILLAVSMSSVVAIVSTILLVRRLQKS